MKKLFLIILLVMPLMVTAEDVNVTANWNAYPSPSGGQIKLDYRVNDGNSTRFGTVDDTKTTMEAIVNMNIGDKICGFVWWEKTGADGVKYKSDPSAEACTVYAPKPEAPTGLNLSANPVPAVQ